MAVTVRGFAGTSYQFDATQWARYERYRGEVGYRHGVPSGLAVTAGGGTRQASITAGTAVLPGLLADSDATVTTTHAANATGANRVDYVVLQADWVTPAASGIVVVQGSSSTPPALTQAEGTLWQMPLARVTVRPSVTTLLSTDVVVCKPLPRVVKSATDALDAPQTRTYNSAGFIIGTITFPDPGWPYRLHIDAAARFDGGTGYGVLEIVVAGVVDQIGETDGLANTGLQTARVGYTTGVLSGPATIQARMRPQSMTSGNLQLFSAGTNFFGVDQIPA
jgi:hypothetical protein